MDQIYISF